MIELPASCLVLSRAQVREVDRRAIEEYGLHGLVLMENAGRNAATLLQELGVCGKVSICCGKGNNAGDGFVAARHLENAGVAVEVLLAVAAEKLNGDAAINLTILRHAGTPIIDPTNQIGELWAEKLSRSDWIVDGLLGTGVQGEVKGPIAEGIDAVNAARRKVFSLDLPSGMDCDSGQPLGHCVRALHTATFVARKPGFEVAGAIDFTGTIHVLDIGAPLRLLREIELEGSRAIGTSALREVIPPP